MLLLLLSPIARLVLWIFFRRLEIRGRDQVPGNRPVLYVANHPNVMLDTLILGLSTPGRIPRFLGKSTLFKNGLYAFFMRRLGVIPVSRTQDSGARIGRNQDMLRESCRVLQQGGSVALFPEGGSQAGRRVRPLKPGGARIALRAEEDCQGVRICIVPVGLAYTDPGLFRSDVSVHFGAPIEVGDFLEAYRANRSGGARALTQVLQERLTALTWHLDNPELDTIFADLTAIYTEQLATDLPETAELSSRLRVGQEIIQAVQHFADTDPALVQSFAQRLQAHHRKLRRLRLEPYALEPGVPAPGPGHLLLGLLLAPPALYGFLNNALPYFVPRLFVRPFAQTPEMVGTIKLSVGMAAFPLYYAIRTAIAWILWGWAVALPYACTLPLSGLFTLYYNEQILQRWPLWQSLIAPRRRRRYLSRLTSERADLIRDLDDLKVQYLERRAQASLQIPPSTA